MLIDEMWDIVVKALYFFPWYVALTLVPALIHSLVVYKLGLEPESFEQSVYGLFKRLLSGSYEGAFRDLVLMVFYFPLFEELVFRGLPYLLFGLPGVVVGSFVWVLMHPAWQLQYLSNRSLGKKLAFTLSATAYYALTATFYSMVWLSGAGLVAILYHMFHNGWLTLADMAKRVELPAPWKKSRYVRPAEGFKTTAVGKKGSGLIGKIKKALGRLVPRRRKPAVKEAEKPPEEVLPMSFVRVKKSLSDEVESIEKYTFVKTKNKNDKHLKHILWWEQDVEDRDVV